jgi:hypothetical protein
MQICTPAAVNVFVVIFVSIAFLFRVFCINYFFVGYLDLESSTYFLENRTSASWCVRFSVRVDGRRKKIINCKYPSSVSVVAS